MKVIERLKGFFKPKAEKPDDLRARIEREKARSKELGERIERLDKEIERLRAEERRDLERFRRSLSRRAPSRSRVPRRQPASQTYTRKKKIRGLPPRSARNKRMWRTQVSKEELDEL